MQQSTNKHKRLASSGTTINSLKQLTLIMWSGYQVPIWILLQRKLLLLNHVNECKQMHRWQFELKGPWIVVALQQPKSSGIAIFLVMICVQKSQRLNLKLISIIKMEAPRLTFQHTFISHVFRRATQLTGFWRMIDVTFLKLEMEQYANKQ